MKNITSMLLVIAMGVFAAQAQADNPNPKPNCPLGQIAVLDGNQWQCKQPDITSGTKPQQGLLLPAVQKVREPASTSQSQPAGQKPTCPKGKIAKLEMGVWQCKDLEITTKPQPAGAAYMKLGDIKGEAK